MDQYFVTRITLQDTSVYTAWSSPVALTPLGTGGMCPPLLQMAGHGGAP